MSEKAERKRRRALEAYARLQRAAAVTAATVERSVQPFGLSASQYGVLDALLAHGPLHQQALAEALGRSKAQMTAIVDALEQRGLVRRERHATDRRFLSVVPTDAGRTLYAQVAPVRLDAIVAMMGELTGDQRTKLARLCRRLVRAGLPADDDERAAAEPAAAEAAAAEPGPAA